MMSLLIVDDEVIIADSLAEMLQEAFTDCLVIYRCYSAADAKALLENERVDIMLTDINMPETSGLDLHSWAAQRWPFIKVIYLTGYSDFQYARQALHQQAFDFVLKSDGDERITATVQHAINALSEDARQFLRNPLFAQARPLYTHQLMDKLLYHPKLRTDLFGPKPGDVEDPAVRGAAGAFGAVHIPPYRRAAAYHHGCDAGAVRAGSAPDAGGYEQAGKSRFWHRELDMAPQTMRSIAVCRRPSGWLKRQSERMTVALIDRPIAWEELALANMRILKQLNALCPSPGEMLSVSLLSATECAAAIAPRLGRKDILKHLREMNEYLLTGQSDLYRESEEALWALIQSDSNTQHIEAVFDIMKMILHTCADNFPEQNQLRIIMFRQNGMRLQDYPNTLAAFTDLQELSDLLLDLHGKRMDRRQQSVVSEVNDYIQAHLGEDLSLTRLAEETHFHPVYLSRIYKEHAGLSLSEYIAEQRLSAASQMLRETKIQIQQIAQITGFTSPGYFARFFRKRKGFSPQEYRNNL